LFFAVQAFVLCLKVFFRLSFILSTSTLALIEEKIPEWSGGAKRSRAMRNCNGKQEKAQNKKHLEIPLLK
jgi:hypothetical protein